MDSLMNHFVVVKKCLSNYNCKIHKALLIKKHNQNLINNCVKTVHLFYYNYSNLVI